MRSSVRLPRTARHALLGAAFLTGLLALLWYAVFHVGYVERIDVSIYYGFQGLDGRPHVSTVAKHIADLCNVSPYVYLAAIPVIVAIVRRRFVIAVAIAGILAGANETTHVLKPLLAAPRPDGVPYWVLPTGTWPSGHATAAMTLALCAVLCSPGRLRPYVAALGAAFAVAVAYSFLTLGWHYPSDALAGFLVAGIWTLGAVAAICVVDARMRQVGDYRPTQLATARALTPPAAALCGALCVLGFVVVVRSDGVFDYARAHMAFVLGAAALGALGLSLATGVMMTLRR